MDMLDKEIDNIISRYHRGLYKISEEYLDGAEQYKLNALEKLKRETRKKLKSLIADREKKMADRFDLYKKTYSDDDKYGNGINRGLGIAVAIITGNEDQVISDISQRAKEWEGR